MYICIMYCLETPALQTREFNFTFGWIWTFTVGCCNAGVLALISLSSGWYPDIHVCICICMIMFICMYTCI